MTEIGNENTGPESAGHEHAGNEHAGIEPLDGVSGGAPLDDTNWLPTVSWVPSEENTSASPAIPASPVPASPMPLSMPPFAAASLEGAVPPGRSVPPGGSAPSDGTMAIDGGGGSPPEPPQLGSHGYLPPPPPPPPPPGRGSRRVVTVAVVAALLAGGLGAGLGASFGSGSSSSPTTSPSTPTKVPVVPSPGASRQASSGPSESVAAIAKAAIPAIVDINTEVASGASQGQEEAAGTGMIITSSGEILTNNHVVEDATKITVSIQGDSNSYAASVIGVDPTKDVALLQVEGHAAPLPTITLGNSSTAAVGNSVVAIGNAQGLGQEPTTVTGIISALNRSISASDESPAAATEHLEGLIETDAPIQPGDSGGPLINGRGQVVGMDTAASTGDSGDTLGYAIPINEARSIVQSMEKGRTTDGIILGESPFLGIFETPDAAPSYQLPSGFAGFGLGATGGSGSTGASGASGTTATGVAISDVAIDGPAQSAGIVGGDTITKIGATATPTIAVLKKAIESDKPGQQVQVTYVDTTGTTHTVSVTLGGIPQ